MASPDARSVLDSVASDSLDRWPKSETEGFGLDPMTIIALIVPLISALVKRCPTSTPEELRGRANEARGTFGFFPRAVVRSEAGRIIRREMGDAKLAGRSEFVKARNTLADHILREASQMPDDKLNRVVVAGRAMEDGR